MSSRIEVTLRPSLATGLVAATPWIALLGFLLIAAAQVSAVLLVPVPLVITGLVWQIRLTGLLAGPRAVTGLLVEDGQLRITLGNGRRQAVTIAPESRLTGHLALLKVVPDDTRLTRWPWQSRLVVFINVGRAGWAGKIATNIEPEAFRQLRVWLRLGSGIPHPA